MKVITLDGLQRRGTGGLGAVASGERDVLNDAMDQINDVIFAMNDANRAGRLGLMTVAAIDAEATALRVRGDVLFTELEAIEASGNQSNLLAWRRRFSSWYNDGVGPFVQRSNNAIGRQGASTGLRTALTVVGALAAVTLVSFAIIYRGLGKKKRRKRRN